eukprot:COSAG01_NODE_2611_length_7384_cov_7.141386_6_plen_349_part_00
MRAVPTTLTMLIFQVDVEAAWQLLSALDAASGGGGGDLFGEGEHAGEFVACPTGVGCRVRSCAGRLTEGAAHRHVRGDGQQRCQPRCRGRGGGAGASEGCVRRLYHFVAHVGLRRTCARIDSEPAMPGVDLGSFLRAMDDACARGGDGGGYAAGVDGPRTAGVTAAGSGFLLRLRQAVRAVLPGPAEQREQVGLAHNPAVGAQADKEEVVAAAEGETEEVVVVASAAAEGEVVEEEENVALAQAGVGEPLPALGDAAAAALPPSSPPPPGRPGTMALGSGDAPLHHLMAARTQSTSTISLDSDVTVSRPFPSWDRPILTEIYLCHAWSCQEIEDGDGRAGLGHRVGRS